MCHEDSTILFCLFLPEDDQLGNDVVQYDHHDLRGELDPELRESEPCDEHGEKRFLAAEGEQPSREEGDDLPQTFLFVVGLRTEHPRTVCEIREQYRPDPRDDVGDQFIDVQTRADKNDFSDAGTTFRACLVGLLMALAPPEPNTVATLFIGAIFPLLTK